MTEKAVRAELKSLMGDPGNGAPTSDVGLDHGKLFAFIAGQRDALEPRTHRISVTRMMADGALTDHKGVAERVGDFARNVFQRYLSSDDLWCGVNEGYLIVYGALGGDLAKQKTLMLAEELLHTVLGDSAPVELVETFAAATKGDDALDFVQVERADLTRRLLAASISSPKSGAATAAPDPSAALDMMTSTERDRLFKSLIFKWRPIWDVGRSAITSFRLMPILFHPDGRAMPDGLTRLRLRAIERPADVALKVFRKSTLELAKAIESGRRMLIVLPVPFRALTKPQDRMSYQALLGTLSAELRSLMIAEITAIPEGSPLGRITEIAGMLRPHFRELFAEVPLANQRFDVFVNAGIRGVSVNLAENRLPEDLVISSMERFTESAARNKLQSSIRGLHSLSLATAAACHGFSFIDGDAIEPATDALPDMSRYRAEDIFVKLVARGRIMIQAAKSASAA